MNNTTESSSLRARKYLWFAAFAALTVILDQWTKIWARQELKPLGYRNSRVVIEGFFNFRYSENPGMAFSIGDQLAGGRILLTVMAFAAFLLVLFYLYKTDPRQTRMHVALGLVGGGAIGNLIDRIAYGKVTDFIVWHVKQHEWPAFNIADAALCIGVGLMALDMFRTKPVPSSTTT